MLKDNRKALQGQYHVPIPLPTKNRAIGVSGLMRIKDEEEYVEASIDSVITALDELIICYQKCSDHTPEIVKRKQKEYPDKIKLYEYAPEIIAHNLTKEERDYAYSLPDDSIHLLSGYYNYTLSKASFRYAVKIDADQVYLTERMKQICDALRSEKPIKMLFHDRLILMPEARAVWYKLVRRIYIKMLFLSGCYEKFYWHSLLKQITHRNCLVFICGIELYRKKDQYLMAVGDFGEGRYKGLYNGGGDHCFFEIAQDTYYYTGKTFIYQNRQQNTYSCIEAFHFKTNMLKLYSPFVWFHMRGCKQKNIEQYAQLKEIDYDFFCKSKSKELQDIGVFIVEKVNESFFSFFHDHFSKPDLNLLKRYLKKNTE